MTTDIYNNYGRVVKCRRCGLVYRSPREEADQVRHAYRSLEDHDYLEERDSRSINAHLSLRVIRRHASGGRLLDVGCATGFLVNAARLGYDAEGLEPSTWAARFVRDKLRLPVHEGMLESFSAPDGTFDVVTMIDVLEHFTDPRVALLQAARLLRRGGLLYLVTPDIGSFSARVMGKYWWGLRPAHLTYFSRKTLTRLLVETGFSVGECRSFGRLFTAGYWLGRLRTYPAPVRWAARMLVQGVGGVDKVVYINTRDSLEICAFRQQS